MIRVLVVDDSATARTLIASVLDSDPAIEVVGSAADGDEALRKTRDLQPDLITMDVNMPVMDGLEATKAIMTALPTPILIVSSIERPALDLSFDATQAGALMVLRKPVGPSDPRYEQDREQLVAMVKAMAAVKVVRRWGPRPSRDSAAERPPGHRPPDGRIVAIGTSTGGPAALRRLLVDLPAGFPAPILVVQHIARGFVGGLASWLGGGCTLTVKVAEEGENLRAGVVYLAPDDRHLGVHPGGRIALASGAPIAGFRPSVTYLFRSVARSHGAATVAALLTGMGSDGVEGLHAVLAAGGQVLLQDESTSVVFGMVQEAIRAGVAGSVLPIERIGPRLMELVS